MLLPSRYIGVPVLVSGILTVQQSICIPKIHIFRFFPLLSSTIGQIKKKEPQGHLNHFNHIPHTRE